MTDSERITQLAAAIEILLRVVADAAAAADPAFAQSHRASLKHIAALVEEVQTPKV